jgi:hypothetical protein
VLEGEHFPLICRISSTIFSTLQFRRNLSNLLEFNLAQKLCPELGNLTELQNLWLASCNPVGEILETLDNLAELTNFYL